jgi:hypothetical protein
MTVAWTAVSLHPNGQVSVVNVRPSRVLAVAEPTKKPLESGLLIIQRVWGPGCAALIAGLFR